MCSGCFGAADTNSDSEDEQTETIPIPYTILATWEQNTGIGEIGQLTEWMILLETTGEGTYEIVVEIQKDNISINPADWSYSSKPTYISIVFQPNSTLVISSDSTSGFTVYDPSAFDDPTGLLSKPGLKPSDHVT